MKVLFVSSEVYPLIKTGGLADVSGALPLALAKLGVDIRILVPAYPAVLAQMPNLTSIGSVDNLPHGLSAELRIGTLPTPAHASDANNGKVEVIVIDCPALYTRKGGPYADSNGVEWQDNALRFGVLSYIAALLSGENTPLNDQWQPDIVHCNDWQTGLVPAYLKLTQANPIKSVISLHNMAFQGCFHADWITQLFLPRAHFQIEGFEYYNQLSFLKAGIYYADAITTVSPTYAQEIQTPAFGFGLEGLLHTRGSEITGILNGIDTAEWNPAHDPHLVKHYDATKLAGKKSVKQALQKLLGLQIDANAPLLGIVSRLTNQKGLDLLLPNLTALLASGCQIALLGSGESKLESAFLAIAAQYPSQVSVTIGYDESLSHQIMAGCDMFIMPSRFEPCGLNQLYGLAYGTLPIVNNTGGLADSVTDASATNIKSKTADGFVMAECSIDGLLAAIERAVNLYKTDAKVWRQLQKTAMQKPLSWDKSALAYLAVYTSLITNE